MTHSKLAHIRVNVRHGNQNELIEIRYLPKNPVNKFLIG